MSHCAFAEMCGSGSHLGKPHLAIDLAYLLLVLAARDVKMNLTAPTFPGAHILAWRIYMEINNYKIGLVP